MKYKLKIAALVLLSVGLAWSILCNLESIAMIKEHREITIQQPREKVFEFLNDNSKISSWVNGIVAIEPFGEPTEGLGAKATITVNVPAEMKMVSTISEWEPPRRFAWSVDIEQMTSRQTYTLEEVGDGTKVTLTVEHRPKGFFMKLLSPVIGWQIKSERAKEMERLKKVLNEL
jgi:uncharacterized protein YndB with AHSA1/START domain